MDIVGVLKDWWPIAGGVVSGAYAAWRAVLKPRIYAPLKKFAKRMVAALTLVEQELSTNGGGSIKDLVLETRDLTLVTRALVDDVRDHETTPLWLASADGRTVRVNRAFEMEFGYANAEVVGTGWIVKFIGADSDRVQKEFDVARREGRMFQSKGMFMTSTGAVLSVRVKGVPVTDKGNRIVAWRGSVEVVQVTS